MTEVPAMYDTQDWRGGIPDRTLFPRHARLAIIGVGLLGMSLLRAAHSCWPTILIDVHDTDPAARAFLREAGLPITVHDEIEAVPPADIFVICTPASAVLDTLAPIATIATPGAIIMDVTSVKGEIMAQFAHRIPPEIHYVSTHPMAGGSSGGPRHGRGDLFIDKPCTLTPFSAVPARAMEMVEQFWTMLGARPGIVASPARHDSRVALTSHLPHLLAFALMDTLDLQMLGPEDRLFMCRSLDEIIRLGGANPAIWRDILCMNREHILTHLDSFSTALQRWRALLASASPEELSSALHHSASVARRMPPAGKVARG